MLAAAPRVCRPPMRSTCGSCRGQTTSCRSSGCSSPLSSGARSPSHSTGAQRHAVPLEHVGGLARVTIPATEIRADRRYVQLRSRLERRPWLEGVPVLSPTDLANVKPHVIVRTPEAFRLRLMTAALWLFAAFWTAHAFRRMRGTIGDPVALPVVLLLCGIGLMSLVALRDPLRDTMSFFASVTGIVAGLGLLVLASRGRPGGVAAAPRGARATRRRCRARHVAAALRHGAGNERRTVAAARVPARGLHPAARGARARRALRATRRVPARVLAGAHAVAPVAASRERAPVEGRRAGRS